MRQLSLFTDYDPTPRTTPAYDRVTARRAITGRVSTVGRRSGS